MTKKCTGYTYIGNKNTKEIHERSKEADNCQIDEIKEWECFDSLAIAKSEGYDNCHWCIGNSKR